MAEMNQEHGRLIAQARAAFDVRRWQEAFDLLTSADAARPLEPDEHEMLAWAARWTGRYSEWVRLMERAGELYLKLEKRRDAGRVAVYLAHHHFERGNEAATQGYAARASRLLGQEAEYAEPGLEAWLASWRACTRGGNRGIERRALQVLWPSCSTTTGRPRGTRRAVGPPFVKVCCIVGPPLVMVAALRRQPAANTPSALPSGS
jgi:hypothetical protein